MDPKILVKHLRQMLLKHPPEILTDIRHKYSQTFGTNTQTLATNIYKPFATSIPTRTQKPSVPKVEGEGERGTSVWD